MEWSRAKNLILILLAGVNIILLILNIYKIQSNTVSTQRIENIMKICSQNDIDINCAMPREIVGTPSLAVREYDYDYVKLQQIFFGSITDVQRTSDLSSVIFTRGEERLTVENSKAVFSCPQRDYANYVAELEELLGKFDAEKKSGKLIYYYQTYRGLPVFSNYICVDQSGSKMTITLNYCSILRWTGERQDIIGADEAVYSAIDRISSDIRGEKAISAIKKGYYDSRTALSQDGTIPPVYALYVNDRVYFVNAYTGMCYR